MWKCRFVWLAIYKIDDDEEFWNYQKKKFSRVKTLLNQFRFIYIPRDFKRRLTEQMIPLINFITQQSQTRSFRQLKRMRVGFARVQINNFYLRAQAFFTTSPHHLVTQGPHRLCSVGETHEPSDPKWFISLFSLAHLAEITDASRRVQSWMVSL